jgi:AP2-like factor (euAP2 lineage)
LTQRWEASLWLQGKQLYLGGFETEEDAARAYDLAAIACKGPEVHTNFPASFYAEELLELEGQGKVSCVVWNSSPFICCTGHATCLHLSSSTT